MGPERNLYRYGENPPHADWPNGARVAVSLALNIEEGSELSVGRGDATNELIYEMVQPSTDFPDEAAISHFDYGPRAGYWRIMRVLERYRLPCYVNACAEVFERAPWMAHDLVKRGHEIGCHGYRWMSHGHMSEGEERAWISGAAESIERVSGVRPLGWHSRVPWSVNTRRLLMEQGFLYDSNAYDDDLPYVIEGPTGPYVVVPYSLDTNDMKYQIPTAVFVSANDFAEYINDAFDWLWEEGATSPKMMTIGLHLRIIGRPARIAGLDRVLRHMTEKGLVWFARRDEIARHWLAKHPLGT